jgi:hypothetical protein
MTLIGFLGLGIALFTVLVWAIEYDARHGWKEVRDSCLNEFDK